MSTHQIKCSLDYSQDPDWVWTHYIKNTFIRRQKSAQKSQVKEHSAVINNSRRQDQHCTRIYCSNLSKSIAKEKWLREIFLWLILNFSFNILGKEVLRPENKTMFKGCCRYMTRLEVKPVVSSCIFPLAQVTNTYQCIVAGLANETQVASCPIFPHHIFVY